ncbi:MAG: hypothetical protein ABJQ39_05075 [Winogradskyella arenosi]
MIVFILVSVLIISFLTLVINDNNFGVLYYYSSSGISLLNTVNPNLTQEVVSNTVGLDNMDKDRKNLDIQMRSVKAALKKNLTHLEFIITIEESLISLAEKDRCTALRLQEYLKIKKAIQLKIIKLTRKLSNYQMKKMRHNNV